MNVTRGLIIDEPWIGHILEGRKDWEMRSQATAHRGWFGLIRKGSGQVVGLARLVDCGKALGHAEMIAAYEHHRLSESMIKSGVFSKWVIPWKLEDIRPLAKPIRYEHRSGAVTWVRFSDDVSQQLASTLVSPLERASDTATLSSRSVVQTTAMTARPEDASKAYRSANRKTHIEVAEPAHTILLRKRITGGSLRNGYISLAGHIDAFPPDTIGGGNKDQAAPRSLIIDWGGPAPVESDIAGDKRIFRNRGIMRQFLAASEAREGDMLVVSATDPYHVYLRLERNG